MKGKNEQSQVSGSIQSSNQEGFWNVKDTAGYLKLQASTVYSLVERREIPHYRVRRQIRFRKEDIDRWMTTEKKEEVVDVQVEARKATRSSQKRSDPRVKRTIRKIIEEVRGEGYTVDNGKPDKDKDLRKGVSNGTL